MHLFTGFSGSMFDIISKATKGHAVAREVFLRRLVFANFASSPVLSIFKRMMRNDAIDIKMKSFYSTGEPSPYA